MYFCMCAVFRGGEKNIVLCMSLFSFHRIKVEYTSCYVIATDYSCVVLPIIDSKQKYQTTAKV